MSAVLTLQTGGYLTNTSSNVNDPAHTGTPSATAGDQIGGSGGGQAHNNMPPFGVLHAFIRF